jgi:hypothetical protein
LADDDIALQIIRMAAEEKNKASNFLNLYQQFADLGYPVENQITTKRAYGEDKSLDVRDPTAIFALDKAASHFIGSWIPSDRFFFGIQVLNNIIANIDHVKRWCSLAVQIAHQEIFRSNYMMQLQNTIKADIGFGTACSYCDWSDVKRKLVFKDWHVSYYTFKQDEEGMVDTVILQYERTARQLVDKFDDPGDEVTKAAKELKDESKMFSIIHVVRPRIRKTFKLISKLNMPFESVYVNVKEKKIMKESGFEEFPFAVSRWEQASCEKWGRGRGLAMLSFIKELQQMRKDYMEACNRYNRPPYEVVHNNVEGEVNLKPDGRNDVTEKGSINPLNPTLYGSIPVTKEALDDQRNIIANQGFYLDVFQQFANLKGDRRVQLEIELRYKEQLRALISPIARMESEHFTPQISRVINLLVRKGRIPAPPPELRGQEYGIEYAGELAMAMRDMHARGFEKAMNLVTQMAPTFPNVMDEINLDRTMPDVLLNYGMKVEHLNTLEEKMALRKTRAIEQQQIKQAQAAQVASETYNKTTKKPEDGSPAGQLMGATQGV